MEFEDPGTNLLDREEVLLEQFKPSFLKGCLRGPGWGAHPCLLGLLWLLVHFGGCDTILGTACSGLVATLQEFKGKSDLEALMRRFPLRRGLISSI